MRKIALVVILAVCFAFVGQAGALAAEQKTSAAPKAAIKPTSSFAMVAGTIESVDVSDPANIKVSVKNDADGVVRTISVTPYTSITKTTDISELKTGDNVRMMTKKADNKEVAMGIMFGKLKPMAAPAATAAKPAAKATVATAKK